MQCFDFLMADEAVGNKVETRMRPSFILINFVTKHQMPGGSCAF